MENGPRLIETSNLGKKQGNGREKKKGSENQGGGRDLQRELPDCRERKRNPPRIKNSSAFCCWGGRTGVFIRLSGEASFKEENLAREEERIRRGKDDPTKMRRGGNKSGPDSGYVRTDWG